MSLRVKALTGIIALCSRALDYFDDDNYEVRVRKGLVNTGDELASRAHELVRQLLASYRDKRTFNPRVDSSYKELDYLEHYCRKWKADRDNLT